MQNLDIEKAKNAWTPLADSIYVPHTVEEYQRMVALLDELIDEVGGDENHSLASLMEIIGVLIEHYENAHVPELVAEQSPS